ncbi:MarR family winged helix-turn-helix transcriptional regulator [Amycolatopsis nigrescens]|uniref:MarR family winged helix-turn-helix transcriptional regulator n=1 Tax=Amycolatopsis nigrescens TaxID=381445 RepID=UPI0003751C3F|nr:MarR family winged helix-turn-helix transcriptional regulator [Amycolatopsis nigrescens]
MTETHWLDETELHAWRAFLAMQRRLFARLAEHQQRECDISPADYDVLAQLSEAPAGRMSSAELGAATQWEKSRLSHHLARMTRRGLVRREAAGAGRYPDVVLTGGGRAAITKAAPVHIADVRAWFIDAIGAERLARFAEDCEAVCAALDANPPAE